MRILKEPFIHFLFIGAVVFAASTFWRSTDRGDGDCDCSAPVDTDIVITPKIMAAIDATDRPSTASAPEVPTDAPISLDDKLNAYVEAEMLYREGLTRGLDKDDAALRGRIIEKMRLIAMEQASLAPIPQKDIEAYYNKNKDSFSWPGRVSVAQLFFDPKAREDAAESDCKAAWKRVQIEPETTPEALSAIADRRHGLRTYMAQLGEDQLAKLFGAPNVDKIMSVKSPGWIAPVKGPLGWHLIRVTEIVHAGTSPLNAMRSQIEKRLEKERNMAAVDAFIDDLKKKYRVKKQ